MDPDTEYLRELNPASAGNLACYTYVNEAFMIDAGCEEPLSATDLAKVGWWKCPAKGESLWDIITTDDTSLKLAKGAKMINPRTAFLGQFIGTGDGGCNFKFTCAGQVLGETSDIQTKTAQYLFFQNYLPTTIKLTDLTVDCEGGSGYMDPDTEYLRDLNPASAGNLACYTYVNEAFMLDAGCEEPLSAKDLAKVGWWKCPSKGESLWDIILTGDTSLQITSDNDVELPAGRAFLGQFIGTGDGGCNFHINFPNPLASVDK